MIKNWLIWVVAVLLILFMMGDSTLLMVLLIAAILGRVLIVFGVERMVVLALFTTLPFSLEIEVFSGSKVMLPVEGIAVVLFFAFLFNLLQFPIEKWKVIYHHWSDYVVLFSSMFFIATIALTTIFSTMPIVSVKFLLVNLLFVSVGMGYTFILMVQQKINLRDLLISILIGLVCMVFFILLKSLGLGIGRGVAPALPKPFFNDHTHLAATLLLILPIAYYLYKTEQKLGCKRLYLMAYLFFIIGLVITFSRAAWMGGFIILMMFVIWHIKLKKQWLIMMFFVGLIFSVMNRSSIESYFQINRNDSNSSESGVSEQIKSVGNITSDVSNLERLNRWKCAVRMGAEKPYFGFGPGTYQFQYLPFQRKGELTRISVRSPFYIKEGRGGTAHSEYLLSFSESGVLGLLSWLAIVLGVIFSFLRISNSNKDYNSRLLVRATFAGMVGFFIHAFFNNFLNAPNFAIYYWSLMSILLFLSHNHRKAKQVC
jgi:putative inorganic carbon (hco3(-)) transporter